MTGSNRSETELSPWQFIARFRSQPEQQDPLTEKQKQVYEFLTTDADSGSAAELFEQFTDRQKRASTPQIVTSEAEFERTLQDLLSEGVIECDYRVSTES